MRQVFVHIDRLILHGVRRSDRNAVAEGLQHALQRELMERATPSRLGHAGSVARMRVTGVDLHQGATASDIGDRVGQGIGRELGK
jgi:hypothetical protein